MSIHDSTAEAIIDFCEQHQMDSHISYDLGFLYDVVDGRASRALDMYTKRRQALPGFDPGERSDYLRKGASGKRTRLGAAAKDIFARCGHGNELLIGCPEAYCQNYARARGFLETPQTARKGRP